MTNNNNNIHNILNDSGMHNIGAWNAMFICVQALKKTHGGSIQMLASAEHKSSLLAIWLKYQCLDRVNLCCERRAKLDSLGFQWQRGRGTHQIKCDYMLAKLKAYVQCHKDHSRSLLWKRDPALAKWALRQRGIQQHLTKDRQLQLSLVLEKKQTEPSNQDDNATISGDDDDDDDDDFWMQQCQKVVCFRVLHGHCRMDIHSTKYRTMARWMTKQRVHAELGELREDRAQHLEAIGVLEKKAVHSVIASHLSKRSVPKSKEDGGGSEDGPRVKYRKISCTTARPGNASHIVDLTEDSSDEAEDVHENIGKSVSNRCPLPLTMRYRREAATLNESALLEVNKRFIKMFDSSGNAGNVTTGTHAAPFVALANIFSSAAPLDTAAIFPTVPGPFVSACDENDGRNDGAGMTHLAETPAAAAAFAGTSNTTNCSGPAASVNDMPSVNRRSHQQYVDRALAVKTHHLQKENSRLCHRLIRQDAIVHFLEKKCYEIDQNISQYGAAQSSGGLLP